MSRQQEAKQLSDVVVDENFDIRSIIPEQGDVNGELEQLRQENQQLKEELERLRRRQREAERIRRQSPSTYIENLRQRSRQFAD